MEQLPILSMTPVVSADYSGNTARRTSICNTVRSLSHVQQQGPTDNEDQNTEHGKIPDIPVNPQLSPHTDSSLQSPKYSEEEPKISVDFPALDIQLDDDVTGSGRSESVATTRSSHYNCPVYEGGPNISPRHPVLTIPLPAGPKGSHYWTQRRVAIYLNKN